MVNVSIYSIHGSYGLPNQPSIESSRGLYLETQTTTCDPHVPIAWTVHVDAAPHARHLSALISIDQLRPNPRFYTDTPVIVP
jgi:hypothetical protein